MERKTAIEMKHITKTFGSVVANKNVNLTVNRGEILSILGENGSGKTTLMNMISGIYFPDEGQIFINGEEAVIASPKDAFDYKIGMIHQHVKLVYVFSAAENIALGLEGEGKYSLKETEMRVRGICEKYGFEVDPKKKIYTMSVSEKQTVEIIKVLYRGADILILDEPTAVLTPQETQKLFAVLRRMRDDGKAIIIITHKLHEVLYGQYGRNRRGGADRNDGGQKGGTQHPPLRTDQYGAAPGGASHQLFQPRRGQGAG